MVRLEGFIVKPFDLSALRAAIQKIEEGNISDY
jgi:hypothetical protein